MPPAGRARRLFGAYLLLGLAAVTASPCSGTWYRSMYRKGFGRRGDRVILWIATAVTAFFWTLPHLLPNLVGLGGQ